MVDSPDVGAWLILVFWIWVFGFRLEVRDPFLSEHLSKRIILGLQHTMGCARRRNAVGFIQVALGFSCPIEVVLLAPLDFDHSLLTNLTKRCLTITPNSPEDV